MVDQLEGNGNDVGEMACPSQPGGVSPGVWSLGGRFFLLNHAFSLPIKYAATGEKLGSEMAIAGPLLFHVKQG